MSEKENPTRFGCAHIVLLVEGGYHETMLQRGEVAIYTKGEDYTRGIYSQEYLLEFLEFVSMGGEILFYAVLDDMTGVLDIYDNLGIRQLSSYSESLSLRIIKVGAVDLQIATGKNEFAIRNHIRMANQSFN